MDTPGYKLRYEQIREGDPSLNEKAEGSGSEELKSYYDQPGHMRNVCFVWPDGRRVFISYAYLTSGELTIDGEMNKIVLTFSNQTVTIEGYKLEELYVALMEQRVLYATQSEERYVDKNTFYISEIINK